MKILIIEDDETLAREIASFLMRWGYETKIPEGFDSIMEEFSHYRPQMVLMILIFPTTTGFTGAARFGRCPRFRFSTSAAGAMIGTRSWPWPRAGTTMWRSLFSWSS